MAKRKKKRPASEPPKPTRTLEPGEYPKGQVAHTRGWEPGDPLDVPATRILVDGVEQSEKPDPIDWTSTRKRREPPDDGKTPIERLLEKQKNAPPDTDEDRRFRRDEELQSRKESLHFRQSFENRMATGSADGETKTDQPKMEKFGSLKLDILLAVILFLVPLGWSVSGFPPNIILACICWGLTLVLVLHVLWIWERTGRWPLWLKVTVTVLVPIVLMAYAWQPVKDEYRKEHPLPPPPSAASAEIAPSLESQRNALRSESSKPLRDVAFHVKLNRQYSIQELGHFRIIFEVFNNQALDWFMACQDLYRPTYDAKFNPFGSHTNVYGYRCVVQYRTGTKTYTVIPMYSKNAVHRYTSLLTGDLLVNTLEWKIDLYNQIPSYKTLEDLNRKYLYVFITAPLVDKINEVSFEANNWELISAKDEILEFIADRPIAPWFLPLSAAEKEIEWRGVYLKDLGGIAKTLPPDKRPTVLIWSLDFASVHARKLPEPEIKYDPLNPPKAN